MDNKLQEYYEESFSTFATKGWKFLEEDMKELRKAVDNLSAIKTEQELWFRKGQLDILDLFLTRKETCEQAWKGLQDE